MPAPFIYLNSWPRLIHSHQHIDLAGTVLPRSSPQYQQLRFQLRQVLFQTLAAASDTFEFMYIFTNFQSDNELGRKVVGHYAEAAKARGCTFIPVVLTCDIAMNTQRIRSQERLRLLAERKGMLLDTVLLSEMREKGGMLK
ncbi:uncharacterized protein BP5553_02677 [Venustampulla echinocandica]|uniref:Uncharacterized protein n=1 Tax=Venustampulla echinocandica TaxID=2656787 RepID=A0A370TS31_9HELO|nr:uncharacterized protein BP5553_02677 [Venustampulla echinocandica]RDL38337.1 hypothetical protein BP5553_02677 [Venustampulla echinocandica]